MKLIILAFMMICLALCVFALPSEDETVGSFDEVDDIADPRNPVEILKKIKKLKKKLHG